VVSSNGKVRKHPWVTYALGLLMLGSFGYLMLPGAVDREAADEAIAAATAFFEANPDVEVDPRFAAIVGPEHVKWIREDAEAQREASGLRSLRGRLRPRTQEKYRRLEEVALTSAETLPAGRFGITDRQSPGVNLLTHVFVHEKPKALVVSLVFFLLAGLALETVWGSLLFTGCCASGSVAAAGAYVVFYGETGSPWIGASGLVATLMGAYFIRAFRGFVIPGWVVLPAWVALEYLLARGIWIENFQSAPVNAHLVGFGLGATGAVLVWLFGIEDRLRDSRSRAPDLVANPVVDQALQAKQDGKLDEALALLQREHTRAPGNRDAAVALWDVATAMGRAALGGPVLLSVVRESLRLGDNGDAVRHWLALAGSLPDFDVEAGLAVRLGEVLLDEGHPDEAVRVLRSVVDTSSQELSSALASRMLRVARDLDPDLTRRVAEVALCDAHLDSAERLHLQSILDGFAEDSLVDAEGSEGDQTDALPAVPEPPLVALEPSHASTPQMDPLQDPHAISADLLSDSAPVEDGAWEFDDYQDPNALSVAALEGDSSQPGDAQATSQTEIDSWNSPGTLEDLSGELSDDEDGVEMGLDALDGQHLGCQDEDTAPQFIMPVQRLRGSADTSDLEADSAAAHPEAGELELDDDTPVDVCERIRPLRVRSAVPLALEETGLALDVAGSGKTILPYERIDAVSVAAVKGLSHKTVIVIDVILNWVSLPGEPLKVIRFRSDEFNPRALAPDAHSVIVALRAVLAEILRRSGAVPLPDADAASGKRFATCSDLTAYQRSVLGADADS
jgi:membrane associated rhomboid family serine protease